MEVRHLSPGCPQAAVLASCWLSLEHTCLLLLLCAMEETPCPELQAPPLPVESMWTTCCCLLVRAEGAAPPRSCPWDPRKLLPQAATQVPPDCDLPRLFDLGGGDELCLRQLRSSPATQRAWSWVRAWGRTSSVSLLTVFWMFVPTFKREIAHCKSHEILEVAAWRSGIFPGQGVFPLLPA